MRTWYRTGMEDHQRVGELVSDLLRHDGELTITPRQGVTVTGYAVRFSFTYYDFIITCLSNTIHEALSCALEMVIEYELRLKGE